MTGATTLTIYQTRTLKNLLKLLKKFLRSASLALPTRESAIRQPQLLNDEFPNLNAVREPLLFRRSTIYATASAEEKIFAGVTDDLIRVNVYIEDIFDLLADFEQAFHNTKNFQLSARF